MIEKITLHPIHFLRLQALKKKVYVPIADLTAEAYVSDEPVPKAQWDDLPYTPFPKGKTWTKTKFGCCVFRFRGTVPPEGKGKKIVALLKLGAEGEAYVKGEAVCGVTPVLSKMDVGQPRIGKQVVPLFSVAKGGETVSFTVDCGNNGYCGTFLYDPRLACAVIAVEDPEVRRYYYDYLFLLLTMLTQGKNERLTAEESKRIDAALSKSYALFQKGKIDEARETLRPLLSVENEKGVTYTAIGHGHLDLAWKWPIRESRRKAIRTFSNVLQYQETYDFAFGASQAQMFEWVEEDEPVLFERVRKAVAEGKIEIQGGMWTESDCNMSGGESLIRQFLYGDKYFLSRFGKTSDVVWLPDVFGFPHTLPQIIAGVGKKYFATIKLSWNTVNEFPLQSFVWKSPDGSGVVAHISPEGTYCASASPLSFVKADVKNKQKNTKHALLIYGVSDGGGGPGEGHLEMVTRAGKAFTPKTRVSSTETFFTDLSENALPVYDGELYLEKHQGTLTSQAKNKYYNRLSERKLHDLEWLETLTEPCPEKESYWKTVLTNQFHDILPGSGIERVHRESVEAYLRVCENLDRETEKRLNALCSGEGLTLFNPSPFPFAGKICAEGKTYEGSVPPYAAAPLSVTTSDRFGRGEDFIEDDALKVTFDVKTGEIRSVYNKKRQREEGKNGVSLHALTLYTDRKTYYDAWDIDPAYLRKPTKKPSLVGFAISESEECVSATVSYTLGVSRIKQKVFLKNTGSIGFETKIDWRETHKMLRASVFPAVYSEQATFDIQFGTVKRSTGEENAIEKAKFEVCGQYYVAVGDENRGYVAVINDGKYGYRVKNGEISLNLLRAPTFPDKTCDRGEQTCYYEIAFADTEEEIVRRGYAVNRPPLLAVGSAAIDAPIRIDEKNVLIETIKPSENGNGIIVRAYERYGKAVITNVETFGKDLFLTDLLENNETKADGNTISFRPHEIKTFLLREKK